MSTDPLRAAILVVSTTAAQDPSTDGCESTLKAVFDGAPWFWNVVDTKIVSDKTGDIQDAVKAWCDKTEDESIHLVVTSGGTGFAIADVTPEAVSPLLEKQAPGLVHAMIASSLQVTPCKYSVFLSLGLYLTRSLLVAMMSRPVAGVRNKTVIVTLPGSPKGARENLEAIIKTLPHACLQAHGANSRSLHKGGIKALEAGVKTGGHSHGNHDHSHSHHHHGCHSHNHSHGHGHGHGNLVRHTKPEDFIGISNDPALGPSRRHRESPYEMVSVDTALELIKKHVPKPEPTTLPVSTALIGSILAQDVVSAENVPAFRASIVDGYAVIVPPDGNMKGVFPVSSVSHAAPGTVPELQSGHIARITTGAPLPPGASAVIMVEDTMLASTTPDGREELTVEILADGVTPGENIRAVGSDIEQGAVVLRAGTKISGVGGEIGVLAAAGVTAVPVFRRPVVGVLSTGDEIIPHDRPGSLRLGEVRDTNRVTLLSAIRSCGFDAIDLGIASDQAGTLEEVLRAGMRQADVLVTSGGVSMGELDLLKPTLERALGGTIHFGRVSMKPGKPTTFATVPFKETSGQRTTRTVFSLPGNPASALVTFHLFVLPALHCMAGETRAGLPTVRVRLSEDVPLDKARPEYHRAVVSATREGTLVAMSTGGQRSSRVGSMSAANALLCMPKGAEPMKAGEAVDALLMGQIHGM
ncbi:hypothetical protein TD95_001488 [Thielaviopsis punctulata]|uniref:MoaB/Mog domain-containing protein n=1 Tax=Thielaviopsis punctulata TaxID=72032 RepID=A0A0F4ZJ58_9PEZI|nr:hypothetical protein TD95_001488 [Thielaviopsis punctulata]